MNIKYKIVLLGNCTVGKTSIADRLTKNIFYDYTETTIGAAYSLLKKGNINMDLWDTAGQERYMSLMPMYFRSADILLLVYDLSDLQSVDRLYYYLTKVSKEITHKYSIIIIGNKLDLIDDQLLEKIDKNITKKIMKYINSDIDINIIFVSAKTNKNMDILSQMITNACIKLNKIEEYTPKTIKLDDTLSYYQYWTSNCNC